MTQNVVMTRLIYLNVLILLAVLDGLVLAIEHNALNLLAGTTGALAIRFAWPKMPIKQSITGFLTGVFFACLFGNSIARQAGVAAALDSYAVWGIVGLLGDILIQFVGWIIRLLQPMGAYTIEHPIQAMDNTLDAGGKVLTFWVRFKAPLLEAHQAMKGFFNPPKP